MDEKQIQVLQRHLESYYKYPPKTNKGYTNYHISVRDAKETYGEEPVNRIIDYLKSKYGFVL